MYFIDRDGNQQFAENLNAGVYEEAHKAGLSVAQYINREYKTDPAKAGGLTSFEQMCRAEGIFIPTEAQKAQGVRCATVGDILNGKARAYDAAVVQQRGGDYGNQSRILFPAAVVEMIENKMAKDLDTDLVTFDKMVAIRLNVGSELFEQPVINYETMQGPDGANRAKAQRIAQLAEPTTMAIFTTTQQAKKIPTYAIGAEFSEQALRATTLDLVALNLARFFRVEADGRVYQYLSDLFNGDSDINLSAISAVTSSTLNGAATSGTLTHKAWVKWLYRNRKQRIIDYVICDLDTYLKIEGRTGRPGSIGVLDPTLPKIDAQATAMNPYIGDVKVFLVDAAADGGPVPANTVWGIDSRDAIVKVVNTSAAYSAAESFAMKRSQAFRIDWSEICYRQYDLAFDVLTID